jgi:hypothetical protein
MEMFEVGKVYVIGMLESHPEGPSEMEHYSHPSPVQEKKVPGEV